MSSPATTPQADRTPLLWARGITVSYPPVVALDHADFALARGEVHALMGENGAGKSTLTRVLAGNVHPSSGTVSMDGHTLSLSGPRAAERLGISTVHQELDLVATMSVADNICLGRYPSRFGLVDRGATRRRAERALERLGVNLDVDDRLDAFPLATQQLVALSRALDIDARVLILDEPTSSLDKVETARLFSVVRRLRDQGMGLILISHVLEQVYDLADRITVLRNGVTVGEWAASALSRSALIEAMTGHTLVPPQSSQTAVHTSLGAEYSGNDAALQWRALGRTRGIAPSSGSVRVGESVGLAGLRGSGRTELARLLFGADRADEGAVSMRNSSVARGSVRAAIGAGLALVPEDRHAQGLVLDLSVAENIALAVQARRGAFRPLGRAQQLRLAQHYIQALGIRTPGPDAPVRQLSGGNQQKVLLARWMAMQPRVLIVDQPTRGIDVGARAEIESLIRSLTAQGLGVLLVSDELDELVRLCGRVMVLRDRRVVGELTGAGVAEATILSLIAAAPDRERA